MNCEIIRDLLPLYVDDVCSDETRKEVEEHLKTCTDCKTIYDFMCSDMEKRAKTKNIPQEKAIYLRIRQQLGGFLICAIIFVAFIAIGFGAMTELGDHGWPQGIFALTFVIPGTAFLLTMLNFFFMREYPSRSWFCWVSAAITFFLCMAGDVVALYHYNFPENWGKYVPGVLMIAAVFSLASFVVSKLYSRFCNR